jgi:hypothetical protein
MRTIFLSSIHQPTNTSVMADTVKIMLNKAEDVLYAHADHRYMPRR